MAIKTKMKTLYFIKSTTYQKNSLLQIIKNVHCNRVYSTEEKAKKALTDSFKQRQLLNHCLRAVEQDNNHLIYEFIDYSLNEHNQVTPTIYKG